MKFLNFYNENIVKYDLINKFNFTNINNIPKFQKITLSFNFNKYDFKLLVSALIALEIISLQKCNLLKSKTSNISLKIRKGNPIGCKVTLRKINMQLFFFKLLNNISLLKKNKLTMFKNLNINNITLKFNNTLMFTELEKNYQFFKKLPGLNLTISVNSSTNNFILFLLKSYKLH